MALSSTAKIMVNQFKQAFGATNAVPEAAIYGLTILNKKVADSRKVVKQSDDQIILQQGIINTAYTALSQGNTQAAFQHYQSVTPSKQILDNDVAQYEANLKSLREAEKKSSGNDKFLAVINDYKTGAPQSKTQALISTLEKNQRDLEGRINTFKINTEGLKNRISSFATKLVADTENLLGKSLGITPPQVGIEEPEISRSGRRL